MNVSYKIKSEIDTKTATINFYVQFDNNDGFLDWMINRKGLKDEFKALSVAISKNKNTMKVIMPIGTTEFQFREMANKKIQSLYNVFSISSYAKTGKDNLTDFFGSLFSGYKT